MSGGQDEAMEAATYRFDRGPSCVAPKLPDEPTILEEAHRLTSTEREADYGHPADDWRRTASIWSAILGVEVTPEKACLCMIAVKLSRECNQPKRDNLVDICGYARCIERIREKMAEGRR